MGLLDYFILGSTGSIFLISLFLLIFSLKSTDDKVKQRTYKKTYVPVITFCLIVFVLDISIVTLGNLVNLVI